MNTVPVSDDDLKRDVDAYMQAGGNRSEAARLRGLPRKTYNDRLVMAQARLKITLGKVVDGTVDCVEAEKRPLPKGKGVARYILSSCQNNTYPHPSLPNFLAYTAWLDKRPADSAEFILGSFSYQMDAYGAKAVKRGAYKHQGPLWYAPELVPYIKDESIQLAPGLIWCGEMNILPTAVHPLTGLDDYNGRNSNIVPHVKHAMESIASLPDEPTKFNYSTGTVTQRNYIKKRAGIVAERKHTYGALLVEVDSAGNWYVRQLTVGRDGEIYDIGPSGYRGVRIANGKVEAIPLSAPVAASVVEAIYWGDIHAAEMDMDVRELAWGAGGMLDQLGARKQFAADIFSMRSRGHHEIDDFHATYRKWVEGEGGVEDEMKVTADWATEADRPWCDFFVIRANHCRHVDRWLNEAKPERDPQNARYFNLLQLQYLSAMDAGNQDFNILEWALRNVEGGIPDAVRFLGEDDSFVICKEYGGGIECALHGDLGTNGARGSTRGLAKLARPTNKGHDHIAAIRGPVFSAGACSLDFPYMKGPGSHSVSHIVNFINATRQIITFWGNKFRA